MELTPTTPPAQEPKIRGYQDYRDFLRERFDYLKSLKPKSVSLEIFARKTEISKTYFRYVLTRKRHITLDKIPVFSKAFGFTREEKQYFTFLVCKNISRDAEMAEYFDYVLSGLGRGEVETPTAPPTLSARNNNVFTTGLAQIIHAMGSLKGFDANSSWIKERLLDPSPSIEDIEEVLESMITSGTLTRKSDGSWVPSEAIVYNQDNTALQGPGNKYEIGLNAARLALTRTDLFRPLRFSVLTLSYDSASLLKAFDALVECRNQLVEISRTTTEPTHVAVSNLNMSTFVRMP